MAARVCAWKVPVEVEIGDFGKFRVVVKRLAVDDRGELLEVIDKVNKLRSGFAADGAADPARAEATVEVAGDIRKQVEALIVEVSGIEFEWGPDETTAPKDIGALIDDLTRLEPLAVADRVFQLWQVCIEEQVLSPFVRSRSCSLPGSANGAPDSSPDRNGTTIPTAGPASRPDSAESGAAATTTTGR